MSLKDPNRDHRRGASANRSESAKPGLMVFLQLCRCLYYAGAE